MERNPKKRGRSHIVPQQTNLPFRGHREDSDSRNQGNFRETLKLLANYSTVISEHFANIELGRKGMTTYLSPTIQNELIELLGKKVKDTTSWRR